MQTRGERSRFAESMIGSLAGAAGFEPANAGTKIRDTDFSHQPKAAEFCGFIHHKER